MCYCGRPTINGEPHAYSWDGTTFSTRAPNPPDLADGDELVSDLPGRCGGTDSHCHHFRIVKARYGGYALLVRHGGGDERHDLGRDTRIVAPLLTLDETARYWFVMRFYHVLADALRVAREAEARRWRTAAAEGRIKTRKQRGRAAVTVWIDEPEAQS
jgi:hypothetical protein